MVPSTSLVTNSVVPPVATTPANCSMFVMFFDEPSLFLILNDVPMPKDGLPYFDFSHLEVLFQFDSPSSLNCPMLVYLNASIIVNHMNQLSLYEPAQLSLYEPGMELFVQYPLPHEVAFGIVC